MQYCERWLRFTGGGRKRQRCCQRRQELRSRTLGPFRTISISFFFLFVCLCVKHANEGNRTRHTSNRMRNKYCKWTHFAVKCGPGSLPLRQTFYFIWVTGYLCSQVSGFGIGIFVSFASTFRPLFYSLPFLAHSSLESPIYSVSFRVGWHIMRSRAHVIRCGQTITNMQTASGSL